MNGDIIIFAMNFYQWFFLEEGRTPEGMFSFAHIASVTVTLALFALIAIFCSKKLKTPKQRNAFLGIMGLFIVLVQIAKYIFLIHESDDTIWKVLIGNAPLYLCDMQIYIIPIAFFTRGRAKNCCCDFIGIWGILMGVFGTYLAGNIYPVHSVISFAAINSLLNHAISLSAGLIVFLTGMNTMEKKNIPIVISILVVFMTAALIIDYVDNHNFMFFFDGGGTPFDLFKTLVNGNLPLYQLEIYILQCGYMGLFYLAYYLITKQISRKKALKTAETSTETVE